MVVPLLKLEFTQGPRAGESLEFKPGSNVRIGRIVRGNDIAVKDAGISTKHLRIVSDSKNWVIHDLGSSNGTFLNSETIDPDTPVNLRDGNIIKLGEYTSLVVNFVTNVETQEHKLPPRARRNNKRLAVSDPDPIELVQDKPARKGRSSKQDEQELPKRTRASRQGNLKDIVDNDKELEVNNEIKVKARVGRPRKQQSIEIAKEEEATEEENRNSRFQRSKKNTKSVQKLGLNAVKLEVEDTPKKVEISEKKRARRSKQIGNADTVVEEKNEKRPSRATRSKKTEIGGDSFMELEMVLNQARKSRAKRKKLDLEPPKSEVDMEARNDDAGEDDLQNRHVVEDKRNEAQESCRQRSDEKEGEGSKRAEQVEIELGKKSTIAEDDLSCTDKKDGETGSLKDMVLVQEECRNTIDSKSKEAGNATSNDGCDEENVEQGSCNKNVEKVEEVDLEKLTAREWLDVMEVQFPKHTSEETEKMIETMRSRDLRIHKHIAEQKGKGL